MSTHSTGPGQQHHRKARPAIRPSGHPKWTCHQQTDPTADPMASLASPALAAGHLRPSLRPGLLLARPSLLALFCFFLSRVEKKPRPSLLLAAPALFLHQHSFGHPTARNASAPASLSTAAYTSRPVDKPWAQQVSLCTVPSTCKIAPIQTSTQQLARPRSRPGHCSCTTCRAPASHSTRPRLHTHVHNSVPTD